MHYTGSFHTDLPELHETTVLHLVDAGVVTTQQLVGKFLSLRHPHDTAEVQCGRFMDWVVVVTPNKQDHSRLLDFVGTCASQCFPNCYDPSVLTV